MQRKRQPSGGDFQAAEKIVDQHFAAVAAAICESLHFLPLAFLRPETARLVETRAYKSMRAVVLEDALEPTGMPATRRLRATLTAFSRELRSLGGLEELTLDVTRSRCALEAHALAALARRSIHVPSIAAAGVETRSRRAHRLFEGEQMVKELRLAAAL